MISFSNNLLFHTPVELFSIIIAYVIFLVAWESKTFLENRYLLLIGISCFFIGTIGLLHALSCERMGIFPGSDTRIKRTDGKTGWVREVLQKFSAESKISWQLQGYIHDITRRKEAEEVLQKIEEARVKEIHHRIK